MTEKEDQFADIRVPFSDRPEFRAFVNKLPMLSLKDMSLFADYIRDAMQTYSDHFLEVVNAPNTNSDFPIILASLRSLTGTLEALFKDEGSCIQLADFYMAIIGTVAGKSEK
jgi:hypothetical protein